MNEDPTEKLIRDLKAENERLKALVAGGKIDPSLLNDLGGGEGGDLDNGKITFSFIQ